MLRVLAFVLLGAIVNVAVAWGCSQWAGRTIIPMRRLPDDIVLRAWWHASCPLPTNGEPEFTDGGKMEYGNALEAAGLRAWVMTVPVPAKDRTRQVHACSLSTGWPMTA